MKDKRNLLFILLGGFFVTNALLAEFIGVKIFSLEKTFGFIPINISLLGIENLSFNLTAGVLLWPVVFIMTDIINEYFGKRGVKLLSFMAAGLICYAYVLVYLSINLTPADFWIQRETSDGLLNMDIAFNTIFGQGLWIIAGSLVAFLLGQLIDVATFHYIRRFTEGRMLWLRATGSTVVSQFIDSFVVLIIAFYIGAGWSLSLVIAIGIVNYIYKFIIAIILTPLLYLLHSAIDKFLGKELAEVMMRDASFESKK